MATEAPIPLFLDTLRRLDEPSLTSTVFIKALGVSEKNLKALVNSGILIPYKRISSKSEIHRGRNWFSPRMVERAFWAFRERAEVGSNSWREIHQYLLGRPENELYQTPEWFAVLEKLKEMGVNITGMRGAEEYAKSRLHENGHRP